MSIDKCGVLAYSIDTNSRKGRFTIMEKYIAVFECSDNGRFIVVCRGYFNRDKQVGCIFPTVEEAKAIYADNAQFIGLL